MTEQQLPEGWQMVKFGDIAKHISKRVEPSETELEVYVGLEHLDPDSLKIKRHGVPSDVAGQKLLVKKGQIIFGKRRAYQRKVAVADWDCICSAHAMVLEANPKHVIPEFLPFFMQSDVFMNRAVAVSEGSLSPTIKWKVLERQTFSFPDLAEQRRLLNILAKLEGVLLSSYAATDSLLAFLDKIKTIHTTKPSNDKNWKKIKIKDVFELQRGFDLPTQDRIEGDVTIYGSNGENGFHNETDVSGPGVITGRSGTIGKVFYTDKEYWPLNTSLYVKDFKGNNPEYVKYFLECMKLERYATGTGVPTLNRNDIHAVTKLWPSKSEQDSIVALLKGVELKIDTLNKHTTSLKNIKKALLNRAA
ncbi:restriction endonuclease subunit S [Marinomonas polaris]|jgi:restriction endonuclease S subunit|uniref:restriction endonuclease subunit S n=1 Tax=Marinomonas polaris TaxID=293552 RepID=UPI003517912F